VTLGHTFIQNIRQFSEVLCHKEEFLYFRVNTINLRMTVIQMPQFPGPGARSWGSRDTEEEQEDKQQLEQRNRHESD